MTYKDLYNKFKYAFRGIITAFTTDNSFKFHLIAALVVMIMAILLHFTIIEWIIALFSIAFVIVAEMFNTAIEYLVRLITDTYHEEAEKLLDISAGAVLLASITSIVGGVLILLRRII
ncbi:diacylglycerol kinase family protein [Spirochaeta cellobiosiphila]|uniref:diacylglycerol kinase family protein n=1 Tax=Spirochaeta cellobiosiphila TaxID=504483 RepID=UPI0004048C22|nr:diacylglycerol kinase family protein [Spirochaeta cellobiosiphila]